MIRWLLIKYTQWSLAAALAACTADPTLELRSHEAARRYYAHKKGTL